jgi:hypothetical protein
MAMLSAFHNVAIHGVSNGHLVGTIGFQETGSKKLLPWVYNLTTEELVLGSTIAVGSGSTSQYMRTAGNGANGVTWHYGYFLRGYQITNYASVSTSTLPTITMSSGTSAPYTGVGNGNTGNGLAVDRLLDRYLPIARNSGDRSSHRPVVYTHNNTYFYPFAVNTLSLNSVGSGRSNSQQILAIPGSNIVVQIVDDPNGNNTFLNLAGSNSERGFNFYGSALGFNGQAARISYSGSGDTATGTLVMTGRAGATAGSYRFRRFTITNQNTGSYVDALTEVALDNGIQDYRVYDYKPNSSSDYIVLYRNTNSIYAAKVSADGTTKVEYGEIANTQGYNAWSSNDSFLYNDQVYTASLMYSGTNGKLLVTKFTG